ncbi:MAG: hypothetical protein HYY25_14870 [Candidatus Wallbacteria bacterium]|nr:hypothetical protein [Candidatus Wallbacteria bacterium]MBI4868285.1 hypothetical protein [Candidatus Wallbacteria bacterium]
MASRITRLMLAIALIAGCITLGTGCGWHDHDHHGHGHYWGHHYDH